MVGSFIFLFYTLPSPHYFYICYRDEYIFGVLNWGIMSKERQKELEDMFIAADPAYQKWDKKNKRDRLKKKYEKKSEKRD